MEADLHQSITLLVVLSRGIFVAFVLGWTLIFAASLTQKIGAAVISAGLAGAPVIFLRALTFERWMYSIGLLLSLAWTRIFSVRKLKKSRQARVLAWLDMIAIVGAT